MIGWRKRKPCFSAQLAAMKLPNGKVSALLAVHGTLLKSTLKNRQQQCVQRLRLLV